MDHANKNANIRSLIVKLHHRSNRHSCRVLHQQLQNELYFQGLITFQNKTSNMFVAIQMAVAAWVIYTRRLLDLINQFSQVAHRAVSIYAEIIAFPPTTTNNQLPRKKSGKQSHSQQKEYLGTSLVH